MNTSTSHNKAKSLRLAKELFYPEKIKYKSIRPALGQELQPIIKDYSTDVLD